MVAGRLQEKNGYFYVVLSYKDDNGKRKEKWIKTGLKIRGNKRRAEELLKEYRANFDIEREKAKRKTTQKKAVNRSAENSTGEEVAAEEGVAEEVVEICPIEEKIDFQNLMTPDMLFGDYMLLWVESIKHTVEITSYAGYKRVIQNMIAPYFNKRGVTLSTLTGKMIDEFYNSELERGLSPNTVIRYHANIRKALQDAYKNDLVPCNYADKAHRPKAVDYIANYYNRDELLRLLEVVKGKQIEFAVMMAAYYGMRREEIVGLKWTCVDFKYKTITVKHTVTECCLDGKLMRVAKDSAKSKKSIRTLPLIKPVQEVLMRIQEQTEENKKFFGNNYNYDDDEYIYRMPNGNMVKPGYVTRHFSDSVMGKNPQLKKIRFHDLRHSCATLLRHEGIPMEDIQKWLGHSQITTTEKLYAHFEYDAHLRSAERIGSALEM